MKNLKLSMVMGITITMTGLVSVLASAIGILVVFGLTCCGCYIGNYDMASLLSYKACEYAYAGMTLGAIVVSNAYAWKLVAKPLGRKILRRL